MNGTAFRSSRQVPAVFGALAVSALVYLFVITVNNYNQFANPESVHPNSSLLESSISLFVFNLLFFSVVGLCVCLTGHRAMKVLRNSGLGYLGRISYGLYLYHNLILALAQKVTGTRELSLPIVLLCLTATLAAAALSWAYRGAPDPGAQESICVSSRQAAARRHARSA